MKGKNRVFRGKRLIAYIPARGGSKGLPGKNSRPMAGFPLVCWSIKFALDSGIFDTVFVSTDSEEIARISREQGAEVPWLRPADLSGDYSEVADAALWDLRKLETELGASFEALVLLQPTSPVRSLLTLTAVLNALFDGPQVKSVVSLAPIKFELSSLFSVGKGGVLLPVLSGLEKPGNRPRDPKIFAPSGAYYAISLSALKESRSFFPDNTVGVVSPRAQNIDIDYLEEFLAAEVLLQNSPSSVGDLA